MIRARTIIGFVAVVLLLVGLSSTSWKRVQMQVQFAGRLLRAEGGYGLRNVRGCTVGLKPDHCVNESLDRSVAQMELLRRTDRNMARMARMFLPKRARPAAKASASPGMKPGADAAKQPPKKPLVPDLRSYLETVNTLGKRSLARMRRARALGAATWYLGILLVLVLFATVVASSLRLQYVPRWARLVATWGPLALALPLATLAISFLAVVGESESVFAGLPMMSILGSIEIKSHNGWPVYVFFAGLIAAVVSGFMARGWQGVPRETAPRARPGDRSRLAPHRTGSPRGAKEVAGLLMNVGDEELEQLDALGAYADFAERRPDIPLSAYAERQAVELARTLGEPRMEVLACERFAQGYPAHPDTATLARAGAQLCDDILRDPERAVKLRKAGGAKA